MTARKKTGCKRINESNFDSNLKWIDGELFKVSDKKINTPDNSSKKSLITLDYNSLKYASFIIVILALVFSLSFFADNNLTGAAIGVAPVIEDNVEEVIDSVIEVNQTEELILDNSTFENDIITNSTNNDTFPEDVIDLVNETISDELIINNTIVNETIEEPVVNNTLLINESNEFINETEEVFIPEINESFENESVTINESIVVNDSIDILTPILDLGVQSRLGISAIEYLSSVILNSTTVYNATVENLTVYTNQDDNASLKLIYDWRKDGNSIAVLNMPFEGKNYNDTFTGDDGDDPDLLKWEYQGSSSLTNIVNNALNVTSSGSAWSATGVKTKYSFLGNFESQVDFSNVDQWPAGQQIESYLSTEQTYCMILKEAGGAVNYASWSSPLSASGGSTVCTSCSSGKLRLRRSGNDILCDYWTGDAWSNYATMSHADHAVSTKVRLFVTPRTSTQIFDTHWDNFKISSGYPAIDYSTYENHGGVNGSTFNSTGGYDGFGAYEFDGTNDYIEVNNLEFTENSSLSIFAWIKPKSFGDYTGIISNLADSPYPGWSFYLHGDGTLGTYLSGHKRTDKTLSINNWNHVGFTYDGDELRTYIDGTLNRTDIDVGYLNNTGLKIGNFREDGSLGADLTFNGTIDEVQIFNRSLSAEQVSALYNNRTDLIVSQETNVDEIWQSCVTPNDGTEDGNRSCSNSLTTSSGPYPNCINTGGDWEVTSSYTLNQNVTCNTITVSNSATLTVNGSYSFTSNNITIASGSSISANEKGYAGGAGPGKGEQGTGNGMPAGGAGHGGYGGTAESNKAGGSPYGNSLIPNTLGSGGGLTAYGDGAGTGGGAIQLIISDTLNLIGTVTANGGYGDSYGGGGAGGSIFVNTSNLIGSGSLSANGGAGLDPDGYTDSGGGAGGRIAVYYDSISGVDITSSSVSGGNAPVGAEDGDAGTLAFIDRDNNLLFINEGWEFQDSANYTNITIAGSSLIKVNKSLEVNSTNLIREDSSSEITCYNTAYTFDLNVINGLNLSNLDIKDGGNDGVDCSNINLNSNDYLFADNTRIDSSGTVTLTSTSTDPITYDDFEIYSTNNVDLNFVNTNLTFNSSTILYNGSASWITLDSNINLTLQNSSFLGSVNLTLQNLVVYSDSSINANERGYASSEGPGDGENGGNVQGGAGAGYGGPGGNGQSGIKGGPSYGNSLTPTDFGSGGGIVSRYAGGAGGGAIILTINETLNLSGTVTANGGTGLTEGSNYVAGGGSGGSIFVNTSNLIGDVSFSANGGNGGDASLADGGGGGGGRIAIYYDTINGINITSASVSGGFGPGNAQDGAVGTLAFIDRDDNLFSSYKGWEFQSDYTYTNITILDSLLRINAVNINLTTTDLITVSNSNLTNNSLNLIIDTFSLNFTNSTFTTNDLDVYYVCAKYETSMSYTPSPTYYVTDTDDDGIGDSCDVVVQLISPEDTSYNYDGNPYLICNATSPTYDLINTTLYHNASGSFINNQTLNVSGSFNQSNFSLTGLSNGNHLWNCKADNGLYSSFAIANYSFIINTDTLNISLDLNPSSTNINQNVIVSGKVNLSDGTNLVNQTINIYLNGAKVAPINGWNHNTSWWNASWDYRKPITVMENNGSDLTSFQVNLSIDTQTLISDGKMQSDCDDLRFTDNESNRIDYWLESGCNTTTTTVWIETNLSANMNNTIFMYYGNPTAILNGSGDNTFVFFANFEDCDLGDLGTCEGFSGADGGSENWDVITGKYLYENTDGDDTTSVTLGSDNYHIYGELKTSRTDSHWGPGFILSGMGGGTLSWRHTESGTEQILRNVGAWDPTTYVVDWGTGYNDVEIKSYSNSVGLYMDGVLKYTYTSFDTSGTKTLSLLSSAGGSSYFDNIKVSKLVDSEPTQGAIGTEQMMTQTNSSGDYNYTITAPATPGTYPILVNTTNNGLYAENTQNLLVQQVPVIESVALNATAQYNNNFHLIANVTDDNIASINFTITDSEGTNVVNNINGTNSGTLWNSSTFTLNKTGTYNYTVIAYDNSGLNDTEVGIIDFVLVSANLNPFSTYINQNVIISGKLNLSNGTKIANQLINIYLNGTAQLGTATSWWNSSWEYKCDLNITEPQGLDRYNQQEVLTLSFLNFSCSNINSANINSIRIIDNDSIELISNATDSNSNGLFDSNDHILFQINMTANQIKNISVYYSLEVNESPSYSLTPANNNLVNGDFELGTYSGWNGYGAGTPWGLSPDNTNDYGTGFGTYWINGYDYAGDGPQGTIYSDPFVIKSDYIAILVSGGASLTDRFVGIDVNNDGSYEDKKVSDGTTETMDATDREYFSTAGYKGQTAVIKVVDASSGGWGHINFDDAWLADSGYSKLTFNNLTMVAISEQSQGTSTNASGDYTYNITAPATAGTYPVVVNATYNDLYAENTQNLIVQQIPVIESVTLNATAQYNNNFHLIANVTDNNIASINFTITDSEGTNVVNNINGTNSGTIWNSSTFILNKTGTYNYTVVAYDSDGFNDTASDIINFLLISETLTPSSVYVNNDFTISGHVNLSNGTNIDNQTINLYRDGTKICENTWWNCNYSYRQKINISNNDASVLINQSTINTTLDTQSLTVAGKMLSDGTDLRVVYWDGTNFNELDRINESEFNLTNTLISFSLQENISVSGESTNYYYYYGNNNPGTIPNDGNKVYLYYDDFNRASLGDDYTESGAGGTWSIASNDYLKCADISDGYPYLNYNNLTMYADRNYQVDTNIYFDPTGDANSWGGFKIFSGHLLDFNTDRYSDRQTGTALEAPEVPTVSVGTWYDVKFIYSGTTLTWYHNGVNAYSDPLTGSGNPSGTWGFVGPYYDDFNLWDDIKIRYYNNNLPTVTLNPEEEVIVKTNSSGDYIFNITSPSSGGTYEMLVNATYDGLYAENTQNLIVQQIPVIESVTLNATAQYNNNFHLIANVTDDNIVNVNFTIIDSDNLNVVDNINGTNSGTIWNSSTFTLNKTGTYNYTVIVYDNSGLNDTEIGIIDFVLVSANLTPSSTYINQNVIVSGKVNLSNSTNLDNQVVNIYLNRTPQSGSATSWWNTSWSNRKPVNITENTGSDLTDYQINFTVNTSGLIAENKLNDNCSDLRFTDNNSNELGYWIESGCNTSSTNVWIRNNFIASVDNIVYMYYGNSLANDNSDTDNVFYLYDDFESGLDTTNKWNLDEGTAPSISSFEGSNRLKTNGAFAFVSKNRSWSQYIYEGDLVMTTINFPGLIYNSYQEDYYYDLYWSIGERWRHFGSIAARASEAGYGWTPTLNTWYHFKIVGDDNDVTITHYLKSTMAQVKTGSYTLNADYNKGGVGFIQYGTGTRAYYDNIQVRQYASTEPTFNNVGEEELNALVTNSSGDYTYNLTAPSSGGTYDILVNTTYAGLYGQALQILNVVISYFPNWSNNLTNLNENTRTGDTVYFNVTWSDDHNGSQSIFSYDNGSGTLVNETAVDWSTTNPYTSSIVKTITAVKNQAVRWMWYANDSNNQFNQTDLWSITIPNLAPLFINSPISNISIDEDTNTQINLSYYFSDPENDSLTYSVSEQTSNSNITYSFLGDNVSITPDANYYGQEWTIFKADDGDGGTNTTNNISITINSVFDSLTIDSSSSLPATKLESITNVNVTAIVSNIESTGTVTCNLTGNFTDEMSTSVNSGASVELTFELGTFSAGTYYYNLTCYDEYNTTTSNNNSFGIASASDPDLRLFSGFIHLSNSNPDVNESIILTAEVENNGQLPASNVLLNLWHGNTNICNGTIDTIYGGARETSTLNDCTYNFSSSGLTFLRLVADPENTVIETDEENNEATRPVYIGNYTQLEGLIVNTSLSHSSVLTEQFFTVSGSATYNSTGDPVKGGTVTITYNGTDTSSIVYTNLNGNFSGVSFSSGTSPGNFSVSTTISDDILFGNNGDSIEVTNRSYASCPTSYPDPDLSITGITFGDGNCVNNTLCQISVDIKNSGCPNVTQVNVSVNDSTTASYLGNASATSINGEGGTNTSEFINWTPTQIGWHTIKTNVDLENSIAEGSETNNVLTETIYIYPPTIDLIPTGLAYSTPVLVNVMKGYTLTIKNEGGIATTNNFSVDLYINDVYYQTQNVTSPLAGFSNSTTVAFTHTATEEGQYNFTFVVDSTNNITEFEELNNNYTRYIYAVSAADLRTKSLTLSNTTNLIKDQIVYANATFDNIGNENVNGTDFNFTFYYNGEAVNVTNFSQALVSTDYSVNNVEINLTNSGIRTIKVCVDPEGNVPEYYVGGANCQEQNLYIYEDYDFTIDTFDVVPAQVYKGQQLNYSVTVENLGATSVDNLSVGLNKTVDSTTTNLNVSNISTIGTFGSTAQINFTHIPNDYGSNIFVVTADHNNNYSETSEINNDANVTRYVYHPDISITSSDILFSNELPFANQNVNVTVNVHNANNYDAANVSVNITIDGESVGNSTLSIVPAESFDSIIIPYNTSQGGYNVLTVYVNQPYWDYEYQDAGGSDNSATKSTLFVRNCNSGNCTTNLTVNYPNGGEYLNGSIFVKAYAYDEDNASDGGNVTFYYTEDNLTYNLIGATNESTGSFFTPGGDGALFNSSFDTSVLSENTAYWIYVNSTICGSDNDTSDDAFYVDFYAPNITLISPENNYINNSYSINLVCNSSDSVGLSNITYYLWNTSGVYTNYTANISGTSNQTIESFFLSDNGEYTWNCLVSDLGNHQRWADNNWTFTIDTIAPGVDNVTEWVDPTPTNNTITNQQNQVLNFTCNESLLSQTWINFNGTTNNSLSNDSTNYWWNITIDEGLHNYTGYCNDTAGNLASTEERIIRLDLTNPNTTLISPIASLSSTETDYTFNCNLSDDFNLSNTTLYVWNAGIEEYSNTTQLAGTENSSNWTTTFSSTGTYTWNCLSYDQAGNYDWGDSNRTLTITAVDTGSSSSSSSSGSSSGSSGGNAYECSTNADCPTDEYCYNHKCVKIFDLKVLTFDSPISSGEMFDFTYFVKGMADISDDVDIEFWLARNEQKITSGNDIIYVGSFEEKIESGALHLPSNTNEGMYQFYIKLKYQDYEIISSRTVEVMKITPLIFSIELIDLPEISSGTPWQYTAVLSVNKDDPVLINYDRSVLRGGEQLWYAKEDLWLNRSQIIVDDVDSLNSGQYELRLIASDGDTTISKIESFTVNSAGFIDGIILDKDYGIYWLLLLIFVLLVIVSRYIYKHRDEIKLFLSNISLRKPKIEIVDLDDKKPIKKETIKPLEPKSFVKSKKERTYTYAKKPKTPKIIRKAYKESIDEKKYSGPVAYVGRYGKDKPLLRKSRTISKSSTSKRKYSVKDELAFKKINKWKKDKQINYQQEGSLIASKLKNLAQIMPTRKKVFVKRSSVISMGKDPKPILRRRKINPEERFKREYSRPLLPDIGDDNLYLAKNHHWPKDEKLPKWLRLKLKEIDFYGERKKVDVNLIHWYERWLESNKQKPHHKKPWNQLKQKRIYRKRFISEEEVKKMKQAYLKEAAKEEQKIKKWSRHEQEVDYDQEMKQIELKLKKWKKVKLKQKGKVKSS